MSVYESKRRQNKALFLKKASELMTLTWTNADKFPKSFKNGYVLEIQSMANKIFDNCSKVTSIYMHKKMLREEFNKREEYIIEVIADLTAMESRLNILYEIINKGNNFLGSKDKSDKMFQKWNGIVIELKRLMTKLKKSDKKRFQEYLEEYKIEKSKKSDKNYKKNSDKDDSKNKKDNNKDNQNNQDNSQEQD